MPIAPRVDTTDADVKQVYQLWRSYLRSRPDSVYDNPHWSEEEKERYADFDISRRWTYGYEVGGRSIHETYGLKPRVLSIERQDSLYAIRTLYAPDDLAHAQEIYSLQRVYAGKENGAWKLYNALSVRTKDWNRARAGALRYIYPPGHTLNEKAAERSAAFVDSLEQAYDLPETEPITYYVARSYDEMARISGLDYAWDGNDGRAYLVNRQIFVGTASASYPHELVHMVFADYDLHPLISEGLATYLGGIGDQSFHELVADVDQRVQQNDLTLERMISGRGVRARTRYVGGAVLVKAADEDGNETLTTFLSLANSKSGIFEAMEQVLGVEREEASGFWQQKLREYSRQ
ncbi:hypothetical protein [Longibacter salinarum]|uniref:hypothetical protein n=1 Tax=Longibacter salinarum TaxID=1850348 RepID=UPI0011807E4B|nr:hypothetical protein [Longibacter salinarum]